MPAQERPEGRVEYHAVRIPIIPIVRQIEDSSPESFDSWIRDNAPGLRRYLTEGGNQTAQRLFQALVRRRMPSTHDMFSCAYDAMLSVIGFDLFSDWVQLTRDAQFWFLYFESVAALVHMSPFRAMQRFPALEPFVTELFTKYAPDDMLHGQILGRQIEEIIMTHRGRNSISETEETLPVMEIFRILMQLDLDTSDKRTMPRATIDRAIRQTDALLERGFIDDRARAFAETVRIRAMHFRARIMTCHTCGTSDNLRVCKHCHRVRYCSRECLRADWREHSQFVVPDGGR